MAEEAEEKTEEESPVESGKKKKIIFLVAGILLLAIMVSIGVFFFLPSESQEKSHDSTAESGISEAEKSDPTQKKEEQNSGGPDSEQEKNIDYKDNASGKSVQETASGINFGSTYSFKPFHLNLGNPLENRYLRLEIAVEFRQGDTQKNEIESRLPQLRDAIIAVASRKTREFLLGPDGKDQLRLEILTKINQYMDMKIDSVFITDLLIE